MIVDFSEKEITDPDEWKSLGVETILISLHDPKDYTDLDRYKRKIDAIKKAGIRAGIYTGLLGLENQIALQINPHLRGWQQRRKDGSAVTIYSDDGNTFCPNSPYVEEFRVPLVQKAVKHLELDVVFFDLPWFFDNGGYCTYCENRFGKEMPDSDQDWNHPNLIPFLKFKRDSIRDAMKKARNMLKSTKKDLEVIFNFGAWMSNIDELSHSTWPSNLSDLEVSALIEYNPYGLGNTPVETVYDIIALVYKSLNKQGRAYFAHSVQDDMGKIYSPERIFEIHKRIREGGGFPFIGAEIVDARKKGILQAPWDEYRHIFEEAVEIRPNQKIATHAVIYDPLSQHYSINPSVPKVSTYQIFQTEYLNPLRECLGELNRQGIAYDVTTFEDLCPAKYKSILLPRTIVISEEDWRMLQKAQESGIEIVSWQHAGYLDNHGQRRETVF